MWTVHRWGADLCSTFPNFHWYPFCTNSAILLNFFPKNKWDWTKVYYWFKPLIKVHSFILTLSWVHYFMILSLLSVVQRSAPLHTRTLGLTWNKIQQTETKKTTFDSTLEKSEKSWKMARIWSARWIKDNHQEVSFVTGTKWGRKVAFKCQKKLQTL